ncbi:M1 family metallopeptidase [Streptomyces sp. ID01-12c]|uniref:Aminopeptidase N n=1 Tax=Streptomyces caniscabiei TaxID=2746961 RepID=A0A927QFC2_9ACTN|nr:M1 family metallopeptidase [Streptomyces caniscabiei]MBD9700949.1 M1 family metallopeptidase [Streptomyces caniscabiei]MBD9724888.1 M1 family metallopeptidase [Streptomyces caniscabiei]MDX3510541.1 M1 family metallopeptidase [Streptomyces caniscabiei]MDX3720624.1 M1 family metallopeptidase [Streptomyces caniscabiei]MDX3727504.1 M1 family metallopeptidase [Streptomyces caniscabiei]
MVSCPRRIAVVSRSARVVPAALLTVALALTLTSCTDGGGEAERAKGSAGLRDPYFPGLGNGGYDVTHYALTLGYDPDARARLRATAVVTARATRDLGSFNLDLRGMDVDSVAVDGVAARWKRAGQELTVTPEQGLDDGESFRTTVRYSGTPVTITDPDGSREGWLPTADGVLALGEPTGSMAWFPGNHHPSDKAAYDLTVTVPEGLGAVSNGELTSESTRDGRTTFSWHTAEPMASYVATLAIGEFEIRRSTVGGRHRLPVYVAVDPSQAEESRAVLGRIPEVVRWAEGNFGPYPFSSTGAIVDRPEDAEYALETQNRPVFPGAPDLSLLVHELAHQWYGDSVTPTSWRDMWLNEGFATYAEWLWEEDHGGDSAQEIFDALYEGDYFQDAADDEAVWDFPPAKPPSAARISDSPVYERGAMVLHKVRTAIGDDAFFELIQGWATAHRHGNADTADFTDYAEEFAATAAPDADLTPIWEDWLYGDGRPPKA